MVPIWHPLTYCASSLTFTRWECLCQSSNSYPGQPGHWGTSEAEGLQPELWICTIPLLKPSFLSMTSPVTLCNDSKMELIVFTTEISLWRFIRLAHREFSIFDLYWSHGFKWSSWMGKTFRVFPIKWKLLLNSSFKEREDGLEGGKSELTSEDKTHICPR